MLNNQLADGDAIEILDNDIGGNIVCQQNSMMWDSADITEELYPRMWEPNRVSGIARRPVCGGTAAHSRRHLAGRVLGLALHLRRVESTPNGVPSTRLPAQRRTAAAAALAGRDCVASRSHTAARRCRRWMAPQSGPG